MQIVRRSPFSGEINVMDIPVTQMQLDRWQAGELAQNVFCGLSADEREFIMTGITPREWEDAFDRCHAQLEEDEKELFSMG